jgi:hypothetical protein
METEEKIIEAKKHFRDFELLQEDTEIFILTKTMICERNLELAMAALRNPNISVNGLEVARSAIFAGSNMRKDRSLVLAPLLSDTHYALNPYDIVDDEIHFTVSDIKTMMKWNKLRGGIETMISWHDSHRWDDNVKHLSAAAQLWDIVHAINELEAHFPGRLSKKLMKKRASFKKVMHLMNVNMNLS